MVRVASTETLTQPRIQATSLAASPVLSHYDEETDPLSANNASSHWVSENTDEGPRSARRDSALVFGRIVPSHVPQFELNISAAHRNQS